MCFFQIIKTVERSRCCHFSPPKGVAQYDQHVRQLSKGAGVCTEELPWVAIKVSRRIGHLRKLLQDAEKLHSEDHQAAYEKEASLIYGYLREAWERGLEEVLLGGIVERYRPGVQTQQVALIADITEADCKALEIAMTKCSKWLTGHERHEPTSRGLSCSRVISPHLTIGSPQPVGAATRARRHRPHEQCQH